LSCLLIACLLVVVDTVTSARAPALGTAAVKCERFSVPMAQTRSEY